MKRLSLQWRITLMTALLIAGACICLNLLLYRSGASGMDNLNGYVLQYQQDGGEDLTIEIPEDQMSDFLVQFSQEVYDTKTIFGRKGWCITAVVTLFSAAIAYFISGKALEPLKELAQQAEKVDQDNLVDVRLEENTVAEFRQLSQSVNQMLDRLAHSFDLQRQFAGNAAHELKTPMTSIIGYADTLYQKTLSPEEVHQLAGIIMNEGMRLEALSFKLMELVTLSQSNFQLEEARIDEVIADAVETIQPTAEKRNVRVQLQTESAWVRLEYDLFKTLLLNLMDNALKSGTDRINIQGSCEKEQYMISIRDYGRGIPQEDLQKITEAFYMVDKSRSRKEHGAGLGLALAVKIAKLHHTELVYESVAGQGTCVSFMLAKEADDEEEEA